MPKRKTILVADDEPHIIELIQLILGSRYKLVCVENGEQAMEQLVKIRPDLILLDVMMPKVNGFEICEKLKGDKKTSNIKIAMLSAMTQERDIMKGLKLGADYYLTKPFDPITLEEQVSKMIKDD